MLTDAQKVTIKADILANADTLAAYEIGNLDALEKLYNADAAPAFIVISSAGSAPVLIGPLPLSRAAACSVLSRAANSCWSKSGNGCRSN